MRIACMLFDGLTALDVVGPYEVLQRLPDADLGFVARRPGVIRTHDTRLGLVADRGFDEVTEADVLVVPGGFATRA